MKDLLDKLSSYNIFNFLLPGVVFAVFVSKATSFKLMQEDVLSGAFVYYFIGAVISRIGSLVVEPALKATKLVMEAVHADPLFYLRVACEERHKTGLYLLDLPPKLAGFTCFMDESMVPGTKAYEQMQREAQAMLDELIDLEADAFQKPETTQGVKS